VIVFVHGVPETAAIWRKVRAAIGVESDVLSLPGFGSPRPPGFSATKDDYVNWLVEQLERYDSPVDLVGHDWGAGLTYRVALTRGDLLHSWVADVGNILHPDYVWHDLAQVWQKPSAGEAALEAQLGMSTEALGERYAALHIPPEDARELAAGIDATMASCILPLYRSSTPNVYQDWGPLKPVSAPGLILHTMKDAFSQADRAREVADALGAEYATLDAHHFWPYEEPEAAAEILKSFWAKVG
jgi:pimeloyl-ACP methyl ester carboxylesterase